MLEMARLEMKKATGISVRSRGDNDDEEIDTKVRKLKKEVRW